jgi:hypothetical protein
MVPAIFDLNAEAGEDVAQETGGRFYTVDVTDAASVAAGAFAEVIRRDGHDPRGGVLRRHRAGGQDRVAGGGA